MLDMDYSDCNDEAGVSIVKAINGDHLHWSEFRQSVLQPFRILSTNSPKSEHIPTTFLARLQTSQKNTSKHDEQRLAWRSNVAADKGVGVSPIFPPYLIPLSPASDAIFRCMMPKSSREGLPLRNPSSKKLLYELPTAKPFCVCGFNLDTFEKSEQCHLNGALRVSGSVVDFERGEVFTTRTICCPFLIFEKIVTNSQEDVETARNHCAVAGAQNLRGQQQLFHKAFGLQTISQRPITFTCAVNNDQAIINFHCVDEEGNYTMAALCKFDLQDDRHFNTFQIWVETIESWASMYLLPRIKGALGQASQNSQTPPPSPLSCFSSLSIDTNSDYLLLSSLRRYWPDTNWQQEGIGETPINSSVAQCGTPMPARNLYSIDSCLPSTTPIDTDQRSSPPRRFLDMLAPIQTNLIATQRIQTPRPLSALSALSRDFFDGRSSSSGSPCRPPSLSPSTPEPEAPVSSKSPMLVLQRRLDIAMNEIQELRGQVEMLQTTLTCKTDRLERRLEMALESKQTTPVATLPQQIPNLTYTKEEVLLFIDDEDCSPSLAMPGSLQQADEVKIADLWRDMLCVYQKTLQRYRPKQIFLLLFLFWLCYNTNIDDLASLTVNLMLTVFVCIPTSVFVA